MGVSQCHLHRVSKQHQKDEKLKALIDTTWDTHPAYGSVRLGLELHINHKRIRRVMKKYQLHPPRGKRRRFCTVSTPDHTYTNLIKNVIPTRQNQIWCSDVSFFWYAGRWWYLATIEDLFTRQILAAQVSRHHDRWLILSVNKQAVTNTGCLPDIFHTDQGTEFMARACTTFWEERVVAISVSDTASPWQNGYKESFFSHFKDEFGDTDRFDSPGEFISAVYTQINYYNHDRIHTALKMPPAAFAQLISDYPRRVLGA